ncbi:MAG TPA: MOSC domain-containing protein [Kofleriaceae bacterium]|nr:MOSC domain-containing protein [Kofleriaceae bacterium]
MTVDELDRLWQERQRAPRTAAVRLIIVRLRARHDLPAAVDVAVGAGVVGDRWARADRRDPDAEVTVMDVRVAEVLAAGGAPIDGVGDNFLVDLALDVGAAPPGTRLRLGGAVLEVTAAPHTGCKKLRQRFGADALRWVNHARHRALRLRGVNCRVVSAGRVALGDPIAITRI